MLYLKMYEQYSTQDQKIDNSWKKNLKSMMKIYFSPVTKMRKNVLIYMKK